MSDSYKDIDGPMTVLATYIVKPEFVDFFVQAYREFLQRNCADGNQQAILNEIGRHENIIVIWEKYTSAESFEEILLGAYEMAKATFDKCLMETPNIKFFSTDSIESS